MRMAASLLLLAAAIGAAPQEPREPFVAVGVVHDVPGEAVEAAVDELRRLRFTVVARRDRTILQGFRAEAIPAFGRNARRASTPVSMDGIDVLHVRSDSPAATVREHAWIAIGRGLRGVIFDGWAALRQNPEALTAAASFADVVTRNAALFAPLTASARAVRIEAAAPEVFARFVESTDAIVLVAANRADSAQRVTLKFPPETPEAIWQNMENGAAVNFIAGPEGPTYSRTFTPHDVVVLMIRKQYR